MVSHFAKGCHRTLTTLCQLVGVHFSTKSFLNFGQGGRKQARFCLAGANGKWNETWNDPYRLFLEGVPLGALPNATEWPL